MDPAPSDSQTSEKEEVSLDDLYFNAEDEDDGKDNDNDDDGDDDDGDGEYNQSSTDNDAVSPPKPSQSHRRGREARQSGQKASLAAKRRADLAEETASPQPSTASPLKKRAKLDSDAFFASLPTDQLKQTCAALVSAVEALKDKRQNRFLCELFMELPSPDEYPSYYEIIASPIDINTIKARSYDSFAAFDADMLTLFANAQLYNQPNSQVYKDASRMRKEYEQAKDAIVSASSATHAIDAAATPKAPRQSAASAAAASSPATKAGKSHSTPAAAASATPQDDDDTGSVLGASWHNPHNRVAKFIRRCLGCLVEVFTAVCLEDMHVFAKGLLVAPSAQAFPMYHSLYGADGGRLPPLDLLAIRKRAAEGRYNSFEKLHDDVSLVCDHIQKFFPADCQLSRDAGSVRAISLERTREARRKYLRMYKQSGAPVLSDENEYGIAFQPTARTGQPSILTPEACEQLASEASDEELLSGLFPFASDRLKALAKSSTSLAASIAAATQSAMETTTALGSPSTDPSTPIGKGKKSAAAAALQPVPASPLASDSKDLLPKGPLDHRALLKACLLDLCNALECIEVPDVDEHGKKYMRQVAEPFIHLPTQHELPEYYALIKDPIDLSTIRAKLTHSPSLYTSFAAFRFDVFLMLRNARLFNDAGSLIYEDSILLQKVFIAKATARFVPDVGSVSFTLRDLERELALETALNDSIPDICFSPLEGECPELDKLESEQRKERGAKGGARGRKRGKETRGAHDAEKDDEAMELGGGLRGAGDGAVPMDVTLPEADGKKSSNEQMQEILNRYAASIGLVEIESHEWKGVHLRKGAFVRVDIGKLYAPRVVLIENLYKYSDTARTAEDGADDDADDDAKRPTNFYFWGTPFLYPHETAHSAKATFLANELFKLPPSSARWFSAHLVTSACTVMFASVWARNVRPRGFAPDDVFVCEYRYNERQRAVHKLKTWEPAVDESGLEPISPEPLHSTRFPSPRALTSEPVPLFMQDVKSEPALVENPLPDCTYFRVLPAFSRRYVVGETLLVSATPFKAVRVSRLWQNERGDSFFSGNMYIKPEECPVALPYTAHNRELIYVKSDSSYPLKDVLQKICVLSAEDYQNGRHVGFSEKDVYFAPTVLDGSGVFPMNSLDEKPALLPHCEFLLFQETDLQPYVSPGATLSRLVAAGVRSFGALLEQAKRMQHGAGVFVPFSDDLTLEPARLERVSHPFAIYWSSTHGGAVFDFSNPPKATDEWLEMIHLQRKTYEFRAILSANALLRRHMTEDPERWARLSQALAELARGFFASLAAQTPGGRPLSSAPLLEAQISVKPFKPLVAPAAGSSPSSSGKAAPPTLAQPVNFAFTGASAPIAYKASFGADVTVRTSTSKFPAIKGAGPALASPASDATPAPAPSAPAVWSATLMASTGTGAGATPGSKATAAGSGPVLICRWHACGKGPFVDKKAILEHIERNHFDFHNPICWWDDCEREGKPYLYANKIMTHVAETHLNVAYVRKKRDESKHSAAASLAQSAYGSAHGTALDATLGASNAPPSLAAAVAAAFLLPGMPGASDANSSSSTGAGASGLGSSSLSLVRPPTTMFSGGPFAVLSGFAPITAPLPFSAPKHTSPLPGTPQYQQLRQQQPTQQPAQQGDGPAPMQDVQPARRQPEPARTMRPTRALAHQVGERPGRSAGLMQGWLSHPEAPAAKHSIEYLQHLAVKRDRASAASTAATAGARGVWATTSDAFSSWHALSSAQASNPDLAHVLETKSAEILQGLL